MVSETPTDGRCNAEIDGGYCEGWQAKDENGDVINGRCRKHGGDENSGAPENNANSVTHGLHTSAETFFANAEEHHLDTYYAVHEALCTRFKRAHGRDPMYHDKKELAQVALSMAKLDMADEYAAENAVDDAKPLTEEQKQMSESGVWHKEVVSKIETLKTDIRRENRLLLKDKGIYASPESQKAEAMEATLSEVLSED